MFKIYKNDEVIAESESPLAITGLQPNTDVTEGEYQAVRVEGDKESARVDVPGFTTLAEEAIIGTSTIGTDFVIN